MENDVERGFCLEILSSRGTHFDPEIVDAFLELETEFDVIRMRLSGS
jgi:response regulator RpfG family c-di-GMP phosphodiesterase